jgi:hypothetical protein
LARAVIASPVPPRYSPIPLQWFTLVSALVLHSLLSAVCVLMSELHLVVLHFIFCEN